MSDLIERANAARNFPENTCGASRHAQQIAEELIESGNCAMLMDDPAHCGESILATVAALWEARTENRQLRADNIYGKHVVEAGVTIYTLRAENERLRAALSAALPVVQAERERVAQMRQIPAIAVRLAELDAVIAQADAAMGSDG